MAIDKLFDVSVLGRSQEYYDGTKKRVGFDVTDGRSLLLHLAGVSFDNRQPLLKNLAIYCKFDKTPQLKLELEPTNVYDKFAVKVLAATSYDDITGEPIYSHIGYIPKGRCPYCARTLSGEKAKSQICPDCGADISFNSPMHSLKTLNKFVTEHFAKVTVGLDRVTKSPVGNSYGVDLWLRVDL